MYQLFFLHLLYPRHLLDIQNEQMKQMQANLVSTIKRSSSVNNEVIEYNRKLLQVCLLLLLQLTLTQHYYGQRLAARSAIDKDNQVTHKKHATAR